MSDWNVGITLDISADNPTASDASLGLSNGIFYWVTGRPGYNGSGYTGDALSGKTWAQHIIKYDKLGDPTRTWDDEDGYASLSGFDFSIDNTSKFWNELQSNNYYVIGREIKVYLFIDDVSKLIWTGKVDKIDYDRIEYKFTCTDKDPHKMFPPTQADDVTYPDIDEGAKGEMIPVTLGMCAKAKLLPVKEATTRVPLFKIGADTGFVASLQDHDYLTREIVLNTPGMSFSENEFEGYYLKLVVGGDEETVLIESNSDSKGSTTTFKIANWFETEPTLDNIHASSTDTSLDVWYFELFRFRTTQIVSEKQIVSIEDSEINTGKDIAFWDSNSEKYAHVGNLVTQYDNSDVENTGRPGVTLKAVEDEKIADIYDYAPVKPTEIIPPSTGIVQSVPKTNPYYYEYNTGSGWSNYGSYDSGTLTFGADNPNLFDLDRDSSYTVLSDSELVIDHAMRNAIWFDVKIPEQLSLLTYQQVYLVFDYSIHCTQVPQKVQMGVNYSCVDHNGRVTDLFFPTSTVNGTGGSDHKNLYDSENVIPDDRDEVDITTEQSQNLIPYLHYGETSGDNSNFHTRKAAIDLSDIIQNSNWMKAYKYIRVQVRMMVQSDGAGPAFTVTQKFKEFAFIGLNKIEFTNQTAYAKTKGEYFNYGAGYETSRVDYLARHIMENYDNIPYGDIIDDGVASSRLWWHMGRQITEQRNSKEYLRELCKQTFTAIVPTRDGKRKLIAWVDQYSEITSHDDSDIQKVLSWKKTSLSRVYNDFQIKYNHDPGLGKRKNQMTVSKTDESAFPALTESTMSDTDRSTNFTSIYVVDYGSHGWWAKFTYSTSQTWISVGKKVSWNDGTDFLTFGEIQTVSSLRTIFWVKFSNTFGIMNGYSSGGGTVTENGSGTPKWSTFVSGINDYAFAKSLWETSHASYIRTGKLNRLPSGLSDLNWYIHNADWGLYYDDAVINYLQRCVEWYTRDKDVVEYLAKATDTNLDLNPAELIGWEHPFYTNGTERKGFITKLRIRLKERDMLIGLKLKPADIIERTYIQETGSNTDQIQETGSNSNQVQETGG